MCVTTYRGQEIVAPLTELERSLLRATHFQKEKAHLLHLSTGKSAIAITLAKNGTQVCQQA